MTSTLRAAAATLLALSACNALKPVNEDTFLEQYTRALCDYEEHCNKSSFVEDFDDVQECVDETLELYEDVDFDGCDFDKDKARSCLDKARDARRDCDPEDVVDDDCSEAFECDGGGFVAGPITPENFTTRYLGAYCGAGCTADLSAVCDATFESDGTSGYGCDFDANAAAECVDVRNWTCEPLIEGSDDTYPTAPPVCANVCG
jgi:hypothetical protein